jgi:hypothetical protein
MRIDLEHPGRAPDAQAFSETRDDAHDELHRGAFAMKDRAAGFVEVSVTGDTRQLPPGLTTGMPIGAHSAAAQPAMVGISRLWTAVRVGVDSPSAASGATDDRRWEARRLGLRTAVCGGIRRRVWALRRVGADGVGGTVWTHEAGRQATRRA